MGESSMRGSLDGIRVLEAASFIAGPYCAMLLADQGADVIKIERPGSGDENRAEPPFFKGESAPFMLWNRNKRSVALDLKADADRENFMRLIDTSDVLIENFRTGAMDRLGFGYEELAKRNPRLIYASVTGYGGTGPLARTGGFDLVLQGFTGLMALSGGEHEGPHRLPVPICDIAAGLYLSVGVLSALQARERTGRGQRVETSLYEAGLALQLYEAASYFATGATPKKLGQKHRGVAPYQVFPTSDGHITLGIAQQNFWVRFCELVGQPELASDSRFATNGERMANNDELVGLMNGILVKDTTEAWLDRLQALGIPSGPIQTTDQALTHEQAVARGMVVSVTHPTVGETKTLGSPIKMSEFPPTVRTPAPLLGEHNDSLLGSLAATESPRRTTGAR
jgi:crotonobetainyl-CoA:carnitine CoA-transferase CaiB-like acyl-CoA transferase